jgi:hypothetical protein
VTEIRGYKTGAKKRMLEVKKKSTTRWFNSSTEGMNPFGLNHYRNCQTTEQKFGFFRKISYTKFIDLTIDTNELLKSFEKNTQYEIRRAQREGVEFSEQITLHEFVEFYNIFAETKQRNKITYSSLEPLIKHLKITKAMAGGDCLVVHLYLCDQTASRAQLRYSATHFRNETNNDTIKLIGFANRFLHYSDMCHFKNLGYKIYDWGGYAYKTENQDLAKINKFKDCFHGNLVEEGNYMSIPLFMIQKAKEIFKKN